MKCRATLRSGTTELKLFTKIVLRLEAGEQSLQFDAANDLLHNAGFYSRYLSEFEGDIVPRHYGVKKKWGETIYCAILEYFSGLPWTGIANGPRDTLENQ